VKKPNVRFPAIKVKEEESTKDEISEKDTADEVVTTESPEADIAETPEADPNESAEPAEPAEQKGNRYNTSVLILGYTRASR
jgi:hypothetical protein